MSMGKLTCSEAKQIDLVDYLASLGYHPQKIRNGDYWYLSPLRNEDTASFKVNRKLNVWYDHASGKGGDLVNFGTQYFNCTVSDFLKRLSMQHDLSFHPQYQKEAREMDLPIIAGEKKAAESKTVITGNRPLAAPSLLRYLDERHIPLAVAQQYCREVDFLLHGRQYTAIGFPNNAGGFELRSRNFKGSSSPKDITFIDNRTEQIAVFEGFFNFLSFATINRNQQAPLTNCLVLNSLSFFERSRTLMERYRQVHLVLDRDAAGIAYTRKALEWDPGRYIDRSGFYQYHKDLNDWLKSQPKQRPQQRLKPRF